MPYHLIGRNCVGVGLELFVNKLLMILLLFLAYSLPKEVFRLRKKIVTTRHTSTLVATWTNVTPRTKELIGVRGLPMGPPNRVEIMGENQVKLE
jgi:hypothetical protein